MFQSHQSPSPARFAALILTLAAGGALANEARATAPIVSPSLVFEERDGIVAIEAEHYFKQRLSDERAWHLTTREMVPAVEPDGDPSHIAGASGGAYLEILPDTRRDHGDELVHGVNFSNEPGRMAILSYQVHFNTPGTYWLWARAFCTTSEDNGLHFGIDGEWPESARRWQTVTRDRWHWKSAQRTEEVHTGVPGILTLEVPKAGRHVIEVSMREDGTALDKILLVNRKDFEPEGLGPQPAAKSGDLPAAFDYVPTAAEAARAAPEPDGDGTVEISGELRQWHKVTLTLDGPWADERDEQPNPFTDHSFRVRFEHESGSPSHTVPGYFAADGDAAESSASAGRKWRAHLSPNKSGEWSYRIEFRTGERAALAGGTAGEPFAAAHGREGRFTIEPSDKQLPDFRARGRLAYVGRHHLQFQGDRSWFLKAGADAPETLLAYADFDDTRALKEDVPLKTWEPHARDWKPGDPSWKDGKGKGLVGALNYLAGKGMNSFSFLPYNVDGDGSNVWPFVGPRDKLHYDCSKLDQWGIVFDHATALGLHLHFKLQETEIDDQRTGNDRKAGEIPAALDGGSLGVERKLYLHELVARFGHALALNWNLGEENTQTTAEVAAMSEYLRGLDPYGHHVVLHTYPDQQDEVYRPLLGKEVLSGVSLQNGWDRVHRQTAKWVAESAAAGRPWVCANDEQNGAGTGVPPDPDYPGKTDAGHSIDDIRKYTLWGNLMAGGAGVEYYFGYGLAENDLLAEDWRSRDQSWDWARIALEFFRREGIPFHEMTCRSELVGNAERDNSRYCLAKEGELYLVYLPNGGSTAVELPEGAFTIAWFNPRTGESGEPAALDTRELTAPDDEDWLALIRR